MKLYDPNKNYIPFNQKFVLFDKAFSRKTYNADVAGTWNLVPFRKIPILSADENCRVIFLHKENKVDIEIYHYYRDLTQQEVAYRLKRLKKMVKLRKIQKMKLMNDKKNLSDVTFVIPIRIDSIDRLENLSVKVEHILKSFDTNIIVLEAAKYNSGILVKVLPKSVEVLYLQDNNIIFHRNSLYKLPC